MAMAAVSTLDPVDLLSDDVTDEERSSIAIERGYKDFTEFAASNLMVNITDDTLFGVFSKFGTTRKSRKVEFFEPLIKGWNKIKFLIGGIDITGVTDPFLSSTDGPKQNCPETSDTSWPRSLETRGFLLKHLEVKRFNWDAELHIDSMSPIEIGETWTLPNSFKDQSYFFIMNEFPNIIGKKVLYTTSTRSVYLDKDIVINFYGLYNLEGKNVGFAMGQERIKAFDPTDEAKCDEGHYYFGLTWYKHLDQQEEEMKGFCITGDQMDYELLDMDSWEDRPEFAMFDLE